MTMARKWPGTVRGRSFGLRFSNAYRNLFADEPLRETESTVRSGATIEAPTPERPENIRIDSFDVSHDGQRILANLVPEQEKAPPMTMVTNWMALLQRK
jgi:hypothetical protein